jgi:Flp pilus assembly protein TadD
MPEGAISIRLRDNPYRAIADYDRALLIDPNMAGAYSNRGTAYARKGRLRARHRGL